MKTKFYCLLTVLALFAGANRAVAQGTAFTYQGQLQNNGSPASGNYNLTFSLFTNDASGVAIAGPVTTNGVIVSNGLFTVVIDFGSDAFTGETNWLQIGVESNGIINFITLTPRQELTPAPYAIYAESAGGVPGLVVEQNTNGAPNLIGGAPVNYVVNGVVAATIGGGGAADISGIAYSNSVTANFGTVGGGGDNTASGAYGTVGGGGGNIASFIYSTVAGGSGNTASDNGAAVGGGYNNGASGASATIDGGADNIATGSGAAVGGGSGNTASGQSSTVAGGSGNSAFGVIYGYSTVGGGSVNMAGNYSTVGGGLSNSATGWGSAIGGGGFDGTPIDTEGNTAIGGGCVIGGGVGNSASGLDSVIGGGAYNITSNQTATVAGGLYNTAGGYESTVVGGIGNVATGYSAFVGGGGFDGVTEVGNTANGAASVVGGGVENIASGPDTTVGGGDNNNASGPGSFIGGGGFDGTSYGQNLASGGGSVIGGGIFNAATGQDSTVSGGEGNIAGGLYSTVSGGDENNASGTLSIVAGGTGNNAKGPNSFAGGNNATAQYQGTFVWSDNTGTLTEDTGGNQFVVRANGGFWFYTGTGSSGAHLNTGATSWTTLCDRNAKKNFKPVDTVAVLDKLAAIPIEQWNYKWEKDTDVPNIGPMAQDFKHAFYPGRDDKGITTLEFDGVELAAIQGLNQKLQEELNRQDAENARLKLQNDSLAERLDELEAAVNQLVAQK
jgi:trimeric autotransporter adhesin